MHRACRRPEGIKAASDRLAIRFVIMNGVAAPTGLSSVVPNAATRRNHSHHHRCRRRSCSLEIFHLALGLLASSIGSVPPAAAAAAANDIPLVCDYSLARKPQQPKRNEFRGFLSGQIGLSLFSFSRFGTVSLVKCIPLRSRGTIDPRVSLVEKPLSCEKLSAQRKLRVCA